VQCEGATSKLDRHSSASKVDFSKHAQQGIHVVFNHGYWYIYGVHKVTKLEANTKLQQPEGRLEVTSWGPRNIRCHRKQFSPRRPGARGLVCTSTCLCARVGVNQYVWYTRAWSWWLKQPTYGRRELPTYFRTFTRLYAVLNCQFVTWASVLCVQLWTAFEEATVDAVKTQA